MTLSVTEALHRFSLHYQQTWQDAFGHLPHNEELFGLVSPCVEKTEQEVVYWQSVPREVMADFTNIENGIEIGIHEDIKAFYGSQFCADMQASWQSKPFTLLQIWSDDDFERLQENILGHLVTQRRLKLKPTVFIGTTDAELDVISVCNITGAVILERLGTNKRDILAEDLASFLQEIEPQISGQEV
ncbi:SecY-interacting protein [Vibrio sp. TH_r3]|uniref:SecY-interacting protein n=1 Tax=Vibrio sp. TH_r3 TaxID=3082084 RepID=UPI002953C3E9|nr:SecY-interacting protein [Vibrio sp. TH_r3]MDV7105021.1 SecY-interacting protein [Vibrio sp. TH_r3]